MKKISAMALCAALILSMTACTRKFKLEFEQQLGQQKLANEYRYEQHEHR